MAKIIMLCIVLAMVGCRTLKVNKATETTLIDSFQVTIVPVAKITGQVPAIGDSLSVPGLNISVHRISETQAVIKTPIRTKTVTETQTTFVPVRQVDKSRIDNRTFTDSYNRTDTDIKDKSRVKDKQIDKEVSQGFPWWLILVSFIIFLVLRYFRSWIKKFLP